MTLCLGCMAELDENTRACPHCGYVVGTGPAEDYFLTPGTFLNDRYIVGKAIGDGGFGITYVGYDVVLNRKIAIKEYYPRQLANRQTQTQQVSVFSGEAKSQYFTGLDSFIAEARKLAEFTGVPAIVDVYDCVMANNTGYIVMEFVSGQTIRTQLKERNRVYAWEEAVRIIGDVLGGLIPVHKAGLIHRDIAPDNIMITDEGQVKVIDFGAARQVIADKSLNYSIILKPGYAPVEQYSSNGKQGPWTDVYAVGATLYRMITGRKPIPSLDRIEMDQLMPPSALGIAIPPAKEQVLMAALAVTKERRIQSAQEFRDALLQGGDTVSPQLAPGGAFYEQSQTMSYGGQYGTGQGQFSYSEPYSQQYSSGGSYSQQYSSGGPYSQQYSYGQGRSISLSQSRSAVSGGLQQEGFYQPQTAPERLDLTTVLKLILVYVLLTAVIAFVVWFGLELALNGRNVFTDLL